MPASKEVRKVKDKRRKVDNRMTTQQASEVEAVVDEYLDEMEVARRKVCDRIADVVMQNPLAEDEILYTIARNAGGDLAMEVGKGLRKRLDKLERMEARADLYRKYEAVMGHE